MNDDLEKDDLKKDDLTEGHADASKTEDAGKGNNDDYEDV